MLSVQRLMGYRMNMRVLRTGGVAMGGWMDFRKEFDVKSEGSS